MSLPSSGASLTTGGNALRRRFRAAKGSLGGDEDLGLTKGDSAGAAAPEPAPAHPILAAHQQRSGLRRFLDAALATEAGLRFLLVLVAGMAAGLWAVAANAGVVAEGKLEVERKGAGLCRALILINSTKQVSSGKRRRRRRRRWEAQRTSMACRVPGRLWILSSPPPAAAAPRTS